MHHVMLNDEPAPRDALGRQKFADALAELVVVSETPLVVGIFGGWGTGKSTLMRLTESKLENRAYTVWFDPWQHQFDEDPAVALLHTMVDKLGLGEDARKLLATIAGALGSFLLKNTVSIDIKEIRDLRESYDEERFRVREKQVRLRAHFGELLSKVTEDGTIRLVFFIDDLDRCAPEQVLKVMEALKLYLNFPGCVYVLGVDRPALQACIEDRYGNLDFGESEYLDKIVQLPFNLPPASTDDMEQFIASLLPEELGELGPVLSSAIGPNPRQVKRFVNALMLNDGLSDSLFGSDHDRRCLTAVLLLQLRAPETYKAVLSEPERAEELLLGIGGEWGTELSTEPAVQRALSELLRDGVEGIEKYIYLSNVASVRSIGFSVTLQTSGDNKIQMVKAVRQLTGLDLAGAKELVESAPAVVVVTPRADEAQRYADMLRAAGGAVSVD